MIILWLFIGLLLRTDPFDQIKVEGGLISGQMDASGNVHIFKGIPFAAPPIGQNRWREPQPVIPWEGLRACVKFSASPIQAIPSPFGPWSTEFLIPKEPINEDCLYLNVWTGAKSASEKRPVLLWIYGGGFMSGGAGVPIYDGAAMAKKGIVYVSANYRVGVFGFFSHPELTKESGHNASGNYGLMDQIAALKWIRKNISAFGGDPDNVTIAGQSAGSLSVNCLVASPLCKGLYKHAIAESGASFVPGVLGMSTTLEKAEAEGLKVQKTLQAASLSDLRNLPAEVLRKGARSFSRPIIDGYVLPESISKVFAEGKQNDVPLLTGWNEDDGVFFGNSPAAQDFRMQLGKNYGADSLKMLAFFPADNDQVAARSQANLLRDMSFGIQNYSWGMAQNKYGKAPVYMYRFARKLPATGDYVKFGAFHTGEVAYAYDNLNFVKRCPWEPIDQRLAEIISNYWVNFIKSGDPNGNGQPDWPSFVPDKKMIIWFGEKVQAEPLPDAMALDFLVSREIH